MTVEKKEICGIVMPISSIDNCNETHWSEVLTIISDAVEKSGFQPNMVSDSDDVAIIHKTIIENLYNNPIVVCDVSGKNPNVMFELGMRLAFDKPTIIIKDDKTTYSFDTSIIEHLEYPRDLRFSKILDFKQKLIDKIKATAAKASSPDGHSSFLKNFSQFKVAKIDTKEVSGQEFIIEEIRGLKNIVSRMEEGRYGTRYRRQNELFKSREDLLKGNIDICLEELSHIDCLDIHKLVSVLPEVSVATIEDMGPNHHHLVVTIKDDEKVPAVRKLIGGLFEQKKNHATKKKLPKINA